MTGIKKEAKHLVSFLEKWTELDVMYYVRGGAWLFSTQFLLILGSLGLAIGFAHLTSKEIFGQFQFVLAVLGTLSVLSFPGANTAVQLGASQNKDGTLLQGVLYKFKRCLFGILGLIIVAVYFYSKHEPRYESIWPIFLVAIIFFPILYSLDVTHSFFVGKRKFSLTCLFQLITEFGSSVIALIALFFTRNLIIILTLYLLVQAFGDVLAFTFARARMKNKKTDSEFNSYSTHLTIINIIPYVKSFFDKLVVTYFLGFAATAVYSIAAAMAEQLYAVSKNVGNIIFPKLSIESKEKTYVEVRKRTGKLALFFILIAVLAVLIAPVIIPFFFSEQYRDAVPIAQLLLLASIPRAIAFVLSRVQEAQKQTKKLYFINSVYAGVEIVALLILAPLYGMYGIVGAKAVSNLVYMFIAWRTTY